MFRQALFIIVIGVMGIGLSACEAYHPTQEVEKANTMTVSASHEFRTALHFKYSEFAQKELNEEKDYADAIHFARKAIDVGQDIHVFPEELSDWDIRQIDMPELHAAYLKLIGALMNEAWRRQPEQTASAQFYYDCWIEEQEELDPDAEACKQGFLSSINQIDMVPVQQETTSKEMSFKRGGGSGNAQTILFEFDKATLTNEAKEKIRMVADDILNMNNPQVTIYGHTDTKGTKGYNNILSYNRVISVWDELQSLGVSGRNIRIDWRGETDQFNKTKDETRAQLNRRVEIIY